MEDWASRTAKEDLEAEERETLRLRREERDAALKDRRGSELFEELNKWMREQATSYNRQLGKKVMDVTVPRISSRDITSQRVFSVSRADGTKQPLKIIYLPDAHRIRCESGAGTKEYVLTVGPDGEARFETPYHVTKTIEEIGEELLSEWRGS
jgi:hypothetical protein